MLKDIKANLLRGSLITSLGQIISVLLLLLSTVILTRNLEAETLGQFFLIIAIWMLIEMIGGLGLEPALVKLLSNQISSNNNKILNEFFVIRLISLIIISVFFYIFSLFLNHQNEIWINYIFYIILIFIFNSLRNFFNAYLQALKLFKVLTIIQNIPVIVKVISYIFLIKFHKIDLELLLQVELFSVITSFILQRILIGKISLRIFLPNKQDLKEIFFLALHLYFNNLLGVFSNRINSIIIASFINYTQVAYYEISRKIPDGFSRLSSSLTMVYYPYAAQLFSENKFNEVEKILNTYFKKIIIFISPVIYILFIFKDPIITILFSSKYSKVSLSMIILFISYLFSLIHSMIGYSLVAGNKANYSFYNNFIRTILNFLLTIIFIVILKSYMGAILSSFISGIIGLFIGTLYLSRIGIHLRFTNILKPLLFSTIFMLFYIVFFTNVAILNIGYSATYLLIYYYLFMRFINFKLKFK